MRNGDGGSIGSGPSAGLGPARSRSCPDALRGQENECASFEIYEQTSSIVDFIYFYRQRRAHAKAPTTASAGISPRVSECRRQEAERSKMN